MKQSAFTIVTAIDQVGGGGVGALEALLNEIGDAIDENRHLRFADLTDLHFASFSVVATEGDDPYLVFEGNVDGRTDAFLRRFLEVAGEAVDTIYAHCVGYPAEGVGAQARVVDYLLDHDIGTNTFYLARPGWSVAEVRREQLLRERIEEVVDDLDPVLAGNQTPEELHQWIGERVREDRDMAWAATPHQLPFLVRHGAKVEVVALAPVGVALLRLIMTAAGAPATGRRRRRARSILVGLAGAAAEVGRRLRAEEVADERREQARQPDWQTAYERWSERLGDIRHREDVQVQNHMISVTTIKPGWFRLATLRLVLWVIDAVARLTSNKGSLGGITSIHFARWVITPDGKRLIFLSNFDGSWESYLNEFIDRAATGLTAVWTNTDTDVGFPPTKWLVTGGARDEARFKAYARASMVPTNTWYSAYPTLTVANISNNMQIRKDLCTALDGAQAQSWLRRL